MNRRERELYHQIHPLKLAADWTAGFAALHLLWRRRLLLALAVALQPSIVVSWALIRWADLEPYRRSRLGRYVGRYMTRRMEAVRLLGYAVMAVGAWLRRPALLTAGLLAILFGWLRRGGVPDRASAHKDVPGYSLDGSRRRVSG